jgi:hypothetical protein
MTPLQVACEHPEAATGIPATAGLARWRTIEQVAGMDAGPGSETLATSKHASR